MALLVLGSDVRGPSFPLFGLTRYLCLAKQNRNFFFGCINRCMNTYIATVRIRGRIARTAIAAESPLTARLLLQFLFGEGNVISQPVLAEDTAKRPPNAEDLFIKGPVDEEVWSVKPKSPQQAQLDALKATKDRATQALKAARQRAKVLKAQQTLRTAIAPRPIPSRRPIT